MISVFVRTLNEAANLPSCLAALRWSSDLVVVDSGSQDDTVAIAKGMGARVFERPLQHEADHFNWIAKNVPFRHPWVYYSDADEVVTEPLRDEMLAVTADPGRSEVAYRLRFKTMLFDTWIRHSSLYPTWVLRLFRPNCVTWTRSTNTHCNASGPIGALREHFLHFTFSNGFEAWFEKHNRYSSGEAREADTLLTARPPALAALMSHDPVARRAALKAWSFRLPCRPFLRFAYMYILRGGILDGRAGLAYCKLLATYERMIDFKLIELRRRRAGLPV